MTAPRAGWLYRGPLRDEQSQGWYVPVMDKNGMLALVDTYLIQSSYSSDKNVSAMIDSIVKMGSEPHQYTITRAVNDYYHGRQGVHYLSELPDEFEEVCYLPDYRYVSDSESREYDPEDVIPYVQLHFEHGYRWHGYTHGVFLVRKDAQKTDARRLEATIDDAYGAIAYPHAARWWADAAKGIRDGMDGVPTELEARYQDLMELTDLIERMEAEVRDLLDAQKDRREAVV